MSLWLSVDCPCVFACRWVGVIASVGEGIGFLFPVNSNTHGLFGHGTKLFEHWSYLSISHLWNVLYVPSASSSYISGSCCEVLLLVIFAQWAGQAENLRRCSRIFADPCSWVSCSKFRRSGVLWCRVRGRGPLRKEKVGSMTVFSFRSRWGCVHVARRCILLKFARSHLFGASFASKGSINIKLVSF